MATWGHHDPSAYLCRPGLPTTACGPRHINQTVCTQMLFLFFWNLPSIFTAGIERSSQLITSDDTDTNNTSTTTLGGKGQLHHLPDVFFD